MKTAGLMLILVLSVTITAAPAWAAPTVDTVAATPTQIPTGKKTSVKVSARISDPQLLMTANLYRVNANGTKTWLGLLNDFGLDGDFKPRDGIFTDAHQFSENVATAINLQVVVFYLLPDKKIHRAESAIVQVQAGGILPPNSPSTISGDGGVTLNIPAGALDFKSFVSLRRVPNTEIVAPADPNLPLAAAVKLTIDGVDDMPGPKLPLVLTVPAPPGAQNGDRFLVTRQIVFESVHVTPDGDIVIGAPTVQLMPVSLATVIGSNVVSQTHPAFTGIQTSGTYAIVGAPGSGFVAGIVREGGLARGGVVVSNDTNSLITITDGNGSYGLFVSVPGGTDFDVIAFHPLRGSAARVTTSTPEGQTVNADITLAPLSPPVNMRPGIRNGGFERRDANGNCELSSWEFTGTALAITQLGPTTAIAAGNREGPAGLNTFFVDAHPGNVTLRPTEGKCMAMIDTGPSPGAVGSAMKQVFKVPQGATTLTLNYNYVSEELPEWVGSQFQDAFQVLITDDLGTTMPVEVTVDGAATLGFTLIGNCGFADGDDTCAHTDWRTATIPIPARLAGTQIAVQLLFSVTDFGDNRWDTRVLVDNIRFSTVWLDIKTLTSNALTLPTVAERVERDVRQANEVLSQSGMNLRIRPIVPVSNAALNDVLQAYPHSTNVGVCSVAQGADGLPLANFHMEPEEVALMNLNRSTTATTDVNVYYVATSSVGGARGWTANPGDFCQEVSVIGNQNWGALVTDIALTSTLAHELGHALITATSTSPLLHTCADAEGTCFTVSGAPETAIVTPGQSLAINGATIKSP